MTAPGSPSALARLAAVRDALARRAVRRPLRELLAAVPAEVLPTGPVTLLGHRSERLTVAVGEGGDAVVAHLARDRRGQRAIAEHRATARSLHEDLRLEGLHGLIPQVIEIDRSSRWLVEQRMPGRTGEALDPTGRSRARRSGVEALAALHRATADEWVVGPADLAAWVHEPVEAVAAVVADPAAARGLQHLHRRLTAELSGRSVQVARLHGDPSPDNVLVDDEGAQVTGLIDWESSTVGLPEVDLLTYLLALRLADGVGELGEAVVDLVTEGWTAEEAELLGPSWSANPDLRPTTLVLLAWLHHVAANLQKTDRYGRNRWWVERNVVRVLAAVAPGGPADDGGDVPPPVQPPSTATAVPPARHRSSRSLSTGTLRLLLGVGTVAGWLAWAADAPVGVRAPIVLGVLLVGLGVALSRCIAVDSALVRTVVAGAGAVSINVLVSEVVLYADRWSPGTHLLVVGLFSLACTFRIPRYQAVIRPPTSASARADVEVPR